jgi:hypothetical protein
MKINLEKLISEDPRFGMYMNAFMSEFVKSDINEFIFTVYKLYQQQVPPDEAADIVREGGEENFTK